MLRKHRRLRFILFALSCLSLGMGLALYALRDNISYYRTAAEAAGMEEGRVFRLGGMVEAGSVRRAGVDLSFAVTDMKGASVMVEYKGIPPDLFREGQGVVAEGAMDARGVFVARELLARHDENYMPPGAHAPPEINEKAAGPPSAHASPETNKEAATPPGVEKP